MIHGPSSTSAGRSVRPKETRLRRLCRSDPNSGGHGTLVNLAEAGLKRKSRSLRSPPVLQTNNPAIGPHDFGRRAAGNGLERPADAEEFEIKIAAKSRNSNMKIRFQPFALGLAYLIAPANLKDGKNDQNHRQGTDQADPGCGTVGAKSHRESIEGVTFRRKSDRLSICILTRDLCDLLVVGVCQAPFLLGRQIFRRIGQCDLEFMLAHMKRTEWPAFSIRHSEAAASAGDCNPVRLRRCGPDHKALLLALCEEQNVILRVANLQPFAESVTAEYARDRLECEISGLRFKDRFFSFLIWEFNKAEIFFLVVGVCSIVAPVVPDCQRNAFGKIAEEFARQQVCLQGIAHPGPEPGARIPP